MTQNEKILYDKSILEYEQILSNISSMDKEFTDKYTDEDYNITADDNEKKEYICELYDEYDKLTQIEFPNKYKKLYKQLSYTVCVRKLTNTMAWLTFVPILDDDIGEYFPPNELYKYESKLEKKLYNKFYVPKNIKEVDFEQLLFKIRKEYLDNNKSLSWVYDEIHKAFYDTNFLELIK